MSVFINLISIVVDYYLQVFLSWLALFLIIKINSPLRKLFWLSDVDTFFLSSMVSINWMCVLGNINGWAPTLKSISRVMCVYTFHTIDSSSSELYLSVHPLYATLYSSISTPHSLVSDMTMHTLLCDITSVPLHIFHLQLSVKLDLLGRNSICILSIVRYSRLALSPTFALAKCSLHKIVIAHADLPAL